MSIADLNQKLLETKPRTELEANYDKTLMLLAALKSGEVAIDQFEMANGGWYLVMDAQQSDPGKAAIPEPTFSRGNAGDVDLTLANGDGCTIEKNHWHSIIANMSYYGEEDYGFYRACHFHSGTPVSESNPLSDKPLLW